MPDPFIDEETRGWKQSLCLYGVPGITLTNNRRCEYCPGAARTPQLQHRRCPLDVSNEPCLFITQTAASAQSGKSEIIFDPLKSLASSSSKAVVATRSGQDHDIESLDELPSASGVLCRRLNTSSPATARSVSDPHVEVIGRERKADHRPESSSRSEVDDLQGEECFPTQELVKGLGSLSIDPDNERRIRLSSGEQLDKKSDVRDFLRNNLGLTPGPVHEETKELDLDHRSLQTEVHPNDTQPNQVERSSEHGLRRNLSSHERYSESDDHDRPVQWQLSMLSSFSDFLLLLCIFLEPLSNVWTCLAEQGRLLISSLILWLRTHTFEGSALPLYKWRVNSRDLKTNRFLGQGCSGIVYETTWSGRGNLARKDFPGVESDVFEIEAARLVELGDVPYLVKSFCWTIDKQSCSLVMEYMRYDLYSVIQKRKGEQRKRKQFAPPFGLIQSIHLISQIALALFHLHLQGIVHGDLKPSNVLVSSEASPISVKVVDFGLIQTKRRSTTLVSHRARCLQTVNWKAPELFEGYLDSLTVDNLWTTSPEASDVDVFSDATIMRAADVYSFGLTCSHILGVQNWDPNLSWVELRKLVSSGLRPQLPSECPSILTSLIASCWAADPQARPFFLDICRRLQVVELEEMPPTERTIFGL